MVHAAYPVSDVIMWGESMGALDALLISAGVKSVPTVRGAMIFSGVCSLANAYAGIGDVTFTRTPPPSSLSSPAASPTADPTQGAPP